MNVKERNTRKGGECGRETESVCSQQSEFQFYPKYHCKTMRFFDLFHFFPEYYEIISLSRLVWSCCCVFMLSAFLSLSFGSRSNMCSFFRLWHTVLFFISCWILSYLVFFMCCLLVCVYLLMFSIEYWMPYAGYLLLSWGSILYMSVFVNFRGW